MEKSSVIFVVLNLLLSAAVAYAKLPVQPIAGMETQLILIALITAGLGTVLGLMEVSGRRFAWVAILLALFVILAIAKYHSLLALGGATWAELLLARFLYGYIFFIIFFIFTHVEKALNNLRPQKRSRP